MYGIIFPHVSTVDEARNAVSACRYPRLPGAPLYDPPGIRGDAPTRAARYWGLSQPDYYARADVWPLAPKGEILAIIQCEDVKAIENLPKILTQVISKSSGNTWAMEHGHPVPGLVPTAPSNRDYAPGFMTDLMCKDLGLAVSAARQLRVPVFVASAAQELLRLASSHGLGRKDFSAVYAFLKPSSREAPV